MTYNDKNFVFKDNLNSIIVKNIRKFRIEKGYTQEQLAVYTGRSFEYIRRVESENGKRGVSLKTLHRIAVVLEKPEGDFFKED